MAASSSRISLSEEVQQVGVELDFVRVSQAVRVGLSPEHQRRLQYEARHLLGLVQLREVSGCG
jgi:hypothetical protein